MTAGRQPAGVEAVAAALRTFRYSVFRLETLQVYSDPGEDAGIAAFHRGDPEPPPNCAEVQWSAMLREHRDAGRVQQRVHIVAEPINDYLAYEICWEYGPHVAAGEDIRIIPITDTWPEDVPQGDFTLFDSRRLFHLSYNPEGVLLAAQPITEPGAIAQACFARDAARHHAVSWSGYIARHPELVRRLPQGIRP